MAKNNPTYLFTRKKPTREQYQEGAQYKKLISILQKNGKNVWEARMLARQLLGRKLKG